MTSQVFQPTGGDETSVDVSGSNVQRSVSDKDTHAVLCEIRDETKKIRFLLEHITNIDLDGDAL